MSEREFRTEIVQSGTWLYAGEVLTEIWIVKQNFESWYEANFDDGPEELNEDGETFQVVIARARQMISLGPARLSLLDAISAAEEVISAKINWSNHSNQKLFGGSLYSVEPVPGGRVAPGNFTPRLSQNRA
jgi:hypothetical protein